MPRPRGKKPAPTHLKLVKGVAKNRVNKSEPDIPLGMPVAPDHLTVEGKAEWENVGLRLYRAGLLGVIDHGILGAYCQAFGRWVVAERALQHFREEMIKKGDPSLGLMMTTINGNLIQNPLVGTANKAMADMARYAVDLGLCASSRSRISAQPVAADDEADRYLA